MSGLILADDRVVHAIDTEHSGTVIPLKKGLYDNLIELSQLALLEKKVIDTVREMGAALHRGEIPAKPVYGGTYSNPHCEYCPYIDVCLYEGNAEENKYAGMKFEECLKKLEEEGEEDA